MTPHYADDWLTVYHGDAKAVLSGLPSESVHCVVTSPPYWGLRDYGEPGQLGLEPTPEAYVESLVAVFREVRRVLRSDGTVWLNLGDSYARAQESNVPQTKDGTTPAYPVHLKAGSSDGLVGRGDRPGSRLSSLTLKPKDLVGIPWMVAFALRADGWYLRSDIIWAKPNPMPESVTDRPTKSHEYVFLLSKSPRYFFDDDAVREGATTETWPGIGPKHGTTSNHKSDYEPMVVNTGRNIRSVWTVATQPYPGAHFATFPPKLIEPCIKAGTSEKGVCPECGAPWERVVLRTFDTEKRDRILARRNVKHDASPNDAENHNMSGNELARLTTRRDGGWRPTCGHLTRCPEPCPRTGGLLPPHVTPEDHIIGYLMPVPATVLDPFAGSGTTGMVAQSLSRRAVLIDLSMDYLGQLLERNRDIPLGLGA